MCHQRFWSKREGGRKEEKEEVFKVPPSLGTGSEPPLLLLLPPSKPPSRKSTTSMVGPSDSFESLATLSPRLIPTLGSGGGPKKAKTKRVFCRAPRSKNFSSCRVDFRFAAPQLGSFWQAKTRARRARTGPNNVWEKRRETHNFPAKGINVFLLKKLRARGFPAQ